MYKKIQSSFSFIPNVLTISRIIITFIVMYLIFIEAPLKSIVIIFIIGALTDFFDGQLARRFNWVSEFGRKADMIADRFLWVGTALAFIISYGLQGLLDWSHGLQLLLMMSREIVSAPFAFVALIQGKKIPHAIFIAKLTTLLQGIALPALLLSLEYNSFQYLSWPVCIVIGFTGTLSGLHYIKDLEMNNEKRKTHTR